MKTLQDLIKDLTNITVKEQKINEYLSREFLDLCRADLQSANLHRADLSGADLEDACLRWADLSGADLQGIKITKEQLDQLTIIEEEE